MPTSFKRFPSSSAAKKRFEARLRKIRWRIYQKIRFKKKRLKRSLDHYKKQVKFFLRQFSLKLKPKETSIWSEKLTKTYNDVLNFLEDARKVGRNNVNARPCFECSNKLDSVLFMLSTVLHLVKTDLAKAAADQEVIKTTLDAAKQSVGESGDYAEERKCNIGATTTAASEIAEAPTNEYNDLVFDPFLLD